MRKFLLPFFLLFFFPLLFPQTVSAQKASPVKCVTCHKTPAQVLPASHKGYRLDKTTPCFTCHKPDGKAKPLGEKIHTVHLQKSANTMKNCFSCHAAAKGGEVVFPGYPDMKGTKDRMQGLFTFFTSWTNSPYLDHSHQQKGFYCLGCHKNYVDEYEATDTQAQCVQCHGDYDEMIKKTANPAYESNPHKSHFVDLKCSACHHGHKEFEDFCAKCHNFGYKAPKKQ